MSRRKYTDEEFIKAVKESVSVAGTFRILGVSISGGTHYTFHKLVKKLNLDISHFTGQGWSNGKTIGPKRPIQDYLNNNKYISSYKLKNRLLKEKIFKPECSNCHITHWLDQPTPLELHHKNGNHFDNTLSNLCLLCPNCHALTDNYRAKNKNGYKYATE